MADFLNLEDVLSLHADQVALYGGGQCATAVPTQHIYV